MPEEQGRESGDEWGRYALALEAAQEGFWDWDPGADRLCGSTRWQAMTGVEARSSSLQSWMERVHPHDKPRLEADLRAMRAGKAKAIRNEHRVRQDERHWRWVMVRGLASRDENGHVTHLAGSLTDTTECRTSDPLTGLPNRLFFMDYLERRMERGRLQGNWNFAVLSVALDRFDRVNETLGCGGGDRLLMETAVRLEEALPEDSMAARLNGAEFLVCLESVPAEERAVELASELAERCRQPFLWGGHRIVPQLAIGIAMAGPSYFHPEDLITDAESALSHARRDEPPGVVCYSRGMRERALEKLQLEADLERALRSHELVMYYQPEVELRTGRILGFEALVRWRHPVRGLLPPSVFIPAAEETGLILPMGDWGLKEACRQLVKWRKAGNPELSSARMSVNLSARQFERPDLVERVRQVLEDTGLEPCSLRLEVTESSLLSDAVPALKTMRELGTLGVGLHMDDFGVGYSSLHYLHRFPFDTLKIDRSFVRGIVHDRESHQIVRTILDLARGFGMDVVAEGIENAEQLEKLKMLGCPCGQGFYFARPMEPAAIESMLRRGRWTGHAAAPAQA